MFRALAKGGLPKVPFEEGQFEVEITPDGPLAMNGLMLEDLQKLFVYHQKPSK